MRKGITLLCFILLTGIFVFSQEYKGKGRLIGFVSDEQGKPLEGVKVKLGWVSNQQSLGGPEVMSDASGKWTASWLRGGNWNVDFEKPGYMPRKISVRVDEFGRNPEINIRLMKAEGLILTDELKNSLNEGNKLFDEGKYEEAIASYALILEKYPDAYIISKNIGNSYFQMEKYDKAEEYYQKILEKEPQNTEAMVLIGNCYVNRGENEKALEWYNKVELEKINNPTVLYNIGTSFANISRFEDALKYYKRAVELKPDFLDGIYQLGLTYLNLSNFEDSIKTFESYLKHDPDSERAAQVKGFIEFLKKK
jgi:tetratricopeptide (TPR) repeat protein